MTDTAQYAAIDDAYDGDDAPKSKRLSVHLATLGPGVVDIVRGADGPLFLIAVDGRPEPVAVLGENGQRAHPFPLSELPWAVPTLDNVVAAHRHDDPSGLFADTRAFVATAAVVPDERWTDLLAGWALLTYRAEDVHHLPLILLHGVPERGKTRLAKAVVYASFRGFVSPGLREAVLIRWRDYHRATLCLDLEDVNRQALRAGVEDLLLASFERGGTVARVLWPERGPGRDMRHFAAYGPTVITTNVAPRADSALATRCVPLVLPEAGGRRFGPPPTPDDGLPLRARAVAWRARTLGTPLVGVEPPVTRRLGDITLPILQVIATVAPGRLKAVSDLVRELAAEVQGRRGESLEGAVVEALVALSPRGDGELSLKTLRQRLNEGRDASDAVSGQLLGRVVRNLGFGVRVGHARERVLRYDEDAVQRIARAFGIEGSTQSSSPSSPSSPTQVVASTYQGELGEHDQANPDEAARDMRGGA